MSKFVKVRFVLSSGELTDGAVDMDRILFLDTVEKNMVRLFYTTKDCYVVEGDVDTLLKQVERRWT